MKRYFYILFLIFFFFIEKTYSTIFFQAGMTLKEWLKKNADTRSSIYYNIDKDSFCNKYMPLERGFSALSINLRHEPGGYRGYEYENLFIDIENSYTFNYFEVKYSQISSKIECYFDQKAEMEGSYDATTVDDISKYREEYTFTSKECPQFLKKIKDILKIVEEFSKRYKCDGGYLNLGHDKYEILIEDGNSSITYISFPLLNKKDKIKKKIDEIYKSAMECYVKAENQRMEKEEE